MSEKIAGNLVSGDRAFYGFLTVKDGRIGEVREESPLQPGADWVLPGFIDMHLHGLGNGEGTGEAGIRAMAEFGPSTGLAGFLPTCEANPVECLTEFAAGVAAVMRDASGSRALGAHSEGPFIAPSNMGGMRRDRLVVPTVELADALLKVFQGNLRLVTLAPELPEMEKIISRLCAAGVIVSAGHTGCSAADFSRAVELGVRQVCHLFDAFDGRMVEGGVSQVSLTDAILIDDRVAVEMIVDGCHVPAGLIELARRAAGPRRIIAITDGMRGAGLPEGIYHTEYDGDYRLSFTAACRRLRDNDLIGSCLTMNQAFDNLVRRFHFSPVEAALATATNAARQLGIADETGSIAPGKRADITIMAADSAAVRQCWIAGRREYVCHG